MSAAAQDGRGRRAACTIVSPNYHKFVRTLCDSYRRHHPDDDFFVLIVADLDASAKSSFEGHGYTPVLPQELGLPDLRSHAMKFDILELNTNVKPSFLKFLLAQGFDEILYLDPDIFVYAPLDPVFDALGSSTAVLTPHMTAPVDDGKLPSEQEILYNGTYNLGFIALRRGEETMRLLDWWEARCLSLGFSEGRTGLFVDQKWMNLAPGLFEGVTVLRHPGCNMGAWNLHERTLGVVEDGYRVNAGHRLCFFHFTGVELDDPESISRNTDRFTLRERPDLSRLMREYKAAVQRNAGTSIDTMPYGFDRLSDGTVITRLARRIYAAHAERWPEHDPFDAGGEFARFAKRRGLLAGKTEQVKESWRHFQQAGKRVMLVHHLLRMALRALGPHRYELLMRYLAHISVLRHQGVFLKPDHRQSGEH